MSSTAPTGLHSDGIDSEGEMAIEEVAELLGLPVAMLVRHIEGGWLPARRVAGPQGVRYRVSAADLGLDDLARSRRPSTAERGSPTVATGRVELTAEPALQSGEEGPPASDTAQAAAAELVEPPPPRALAAIDVRSTDLGALTGDTNLLIATLLERWQQALEQRIHAEYRLRYENELVANQSQTKQLQLELQVIRAHHALAIAQKENVLSDRQRELEEARGQVGDGRAALAALAARDRSLADRDRALAERDRALVSLREELAVARARLAQLTDLETRVPAAAAALEELHGQMQAARDALRERDRQLAELERELAERDRAIGVRDDELQRVHHQLDEARSLPRRRGLLHRR